MAQTRMGTVTILFTDLESSTEVLQQLGDDEARLLWRAHFRLLREAITSRGGREVKNLGDGLMVVFSSALDALACAVAVQQAVQRHNRRQDERHRMQVRVGLEIGEPIRDEDDYFGMPVVIARRLCDSAQGGQIIVSDLVRRLAGSRGVYMFRGPQEMRLKGISEPVPVYQLDWQPAAQRPLMPVPLAGERSAFVGRQRELDSLRQHWDRARNGERRLVFLTGEPGIGKTRLALEFARVAHAEGAAVLYGHSDEGAAISYQPFAEALRQYAAACSLAELPVRLGTAAADLTDRLPGPPAVSPDAAAGERQRLFDEFVAFLAELSYSSPTILILDDLHWADEPTLQLLRHLARSSGQLPLLILGTYRDKEVKRGHPLSAALADLRRHRAFEHVPLEGLGESEVGALMSPWLHEEAPLSFVRAIHEQTEGNPFFIEEVLRHLSETGVVSSEGGRRLTDAAVLEMAIPQSLKDVIGQRLSRLSQECNSILTAAAVKGREFALEDLERASGLPGQRLLDPLEEAMRAGMIAEVPHTAGRYSFSHTLIYETLYEELTTTARVLLHGQTLLYADSEGVKLAYEVLGSAGPYLIPLGLSNCPSVRSRIWTMARSWDRMARRCRVILYDRRGVGFSAAPERGYSLQDSVDDLRAVLDAVGVERVVLWGATDGGPLAIAFAAQRPERVSGLILLGTTPKLVSWGDFAWGISPAVADSFLRLDAVDQGQAASQVTRIRPYRPEDAEAIGEVMRRVPRPAWSKILGAMVAADARSLLQQVRAPTLIVHDPGNRYIPVEAAHYLHEHIPGSRLEVTEEYGAALFGDTLYGKIEAFIEEATARSPP